MCISWSLVRGRVALHFQFIYLLQGILSSYSICVVINFCTKDALWACTATLLISNCPSMMEASLKTSTYASLGSPKNLPPNSLVYTHRNNFKGFEDQIRFNASTRRLIMWALNVWTMWALGDWKMWVLKALGTSAILVQRPMSHCFWHPYNTDEFLLQCESLILMVLGIRSNCEITRFEFS